MSTEANLVTLTRLAATDLSAAQYKFVKQNTSGAVTTCGTAGERALGVLQNDPADTEPATVAYAGIVKVIAGAAVSVGAEVMTDTSGRAITATATNVALGEAMSAAGAAGVVINVLLRTRSL